MPDEKPEPVVTDEMLTKMASPARPNWKAESKARDDMYLRQWAIDQAVKLEQANASFQDPEGMTQRVLSNAERFISFITSVISD